MSPLAPHLAEDRVLLLDGGLATELEHRGHDLGDPLWSARLLLDDPEAIAAVHDDYLAAGADAVIAASYQASAPGLRARGLDDRAAAAVLARAITLARRACERAWRARAGQDHGRPAPLAVASLGPYGAYLADGSEYHGNYTASDEALLAFHRERLDALGPLAELVAFETIPSLREAQIIARALAERPTPAWVSFQCRDDAHVAHGEPIERCAEAVLRSPSVIALGVNCCAPAHVEGLVRRLRVLTTRPLVAYPNAGERYVGGRWCGEQTSPTTLVELAERWADAGARILGGCCRTTPLHIAALDRWRRRRAPA